MLMKIAKAKSFKYVARNITAKDLVNPELEWIRVLSNEIAIDWERINWSMCKTGNEWTMNHCLLLEQIDWMDEKYIE